MATLDRIGFEAEPFHFSHKLRSEHSHWFHAHRGIEMLYIHRGSGEIRLEGKSYPLSDGTLLWIQPYQLHLVNVPSSPASEYVRTNLTFDPHRLTGYLAPFPGLRRFYERLWKDNLPKQVFSLGKDGRFLGILEELEEVRADVSAECEENFGLVMLKLLGFLRQSVFTEVLPGTNASPRALQHVESIMEWLETRFRRPFRLEDMAEDLFLSPYHLSHLFKEHAGITISDYLAFRRTREACSLLAYSSKTVKEIALEVGGLTSSYFCQMFKKKKGVTPEQYRKTIREKRGGV